MDIFLYRRYVQSKAAVRDETAVDHLRGVIRDVRSARPFDIDAIVVLPDHIHCIWSLPEGDIDYSKRWGMIKAGFTRHAGKGIASQNASRIRRHEGENWQRRFGNIRYGMIMIIKCIVIIFITIR